MDCNNINNCSTTFNVPQKSLKDRRARSEYRIDNPNRKEFDVIQYDGCVFKGLPNNTICDFGLKTDSTSYYVELKGSDVSHGIKQLISSISGTKSCFEGLTLKARIIVTKFSKPEAVKNTKEYRQLAKMVSFKPDANNNLVIKQLVYKELI